MPRLVLSPATMPVSGIRRIHEIALTLPDVIGLAVGEPDVAVAQHVLEAGSVAWLADDTNYTANAGILPLRRALAEKVRRDNGIAAGAVPSVRAVRGGSACASLPAKTRCSPGSGDCLGPDCLSTVQETPLQMSTDQDRIAAIRPFGPEPCGIS